MTDREQMLNDVLNQVAIELDIPPHKYKEAMERFESIKGHLEEGNYPGSAPPPSIYIQGSFHLGTVIRPIKGGKECGFDLDIVCQVNRQKNGDDPETLKDEVGAEVTDYADQNGMDAPDNSRRCWALNYAPDSEGVGFHVDILPCLPDMATGLQINAANPGWLTTVWQFTKTTIAITNRDDDVTPPEHDWRSSNPVGFARWFTDICQPGYAHVDNLRQKTLLFETYGQRQNFPFRRAEDIPDALVRTPLQRAIQIMKRHRDVRFKGRRDEKHKPISMIITTLAARLYAGRASQYQTTRSVLRFIVETLAQHAALVDNRALLEDVGRMHLIRRVGDKWYIPNPVNPHNPGDPDDKGENFADRWHEDNHAKARAFFLWVGWLKADLDGLLNSTGVAGMEMTLNEAFGDTVATRTLNRLGVQPTSNRAGAFVQARSTALSKFNVTHRAQPQWPAQYCYDITLTAQLRRDGFRPRDLRSEGDALPKGCSLVFQANTSVPRPFKVYWQVVNTGRAAADAGDLRGEIIDAQLYQGDLTWDREWACVRFGSLGNTYGGLAGKSIDDFGVGHPYIPYLNIFDNAYIDPGRMDYVRVGDNENQNQVRYGDIFFTTSSETQLEVGMASVLLADLPRTYLNSFCFGFRLYDFASLWPEFAGHLLRGGTVRRAIARLSQGATRYNLPQSCIKDLHIPIPPLTEQKRIAAVLGAADREIVLLEKKLAALRELKKGLMQKLLSGGDRASASEHDHLRDVRKKV